MSCSALLRPLVSQQHLLITSVLLRQLIHTAAPALSPSAVSRHRASAAPLLDTVWRPGQQPGRGGCRRWAGGSPAAFPTVPSPVERMFENRKWLHRPNVAEGVLSPRGGLAVTLSTTWIRRCSSTAPARPSEFW